MQDELPLHGSVEVNDRYTADTSRRAPSVNLSYDNLFQRFHSLSLQYQTAPEEPREARVFAATYLAPVTRPATCSRCMRSTPTATWPRSARCPCSARAASTVRATSCRCRDGGCSTAVTFGARLQGFRRRASSWSDDATHTPISYASWSVGYSGWPRTFARRTGLQSRRELRASRPRRTIRQEFEDKRFQAKPNYFYLRGDAQHERRFLWGTASGAASRRPVRHRAVDQQRAVLDRRRRNGARLSRIRSAGRLRCQRYVRIAHAVVATRARRLDGRAVLCSRSSMRAWCASSTRLPRGRPDAQRRSVERRRRPALAGFGGLEAALDWAYPLRATNGVGCGDSRIHFRVRLWILSAGAIATTNDTTRILRLQSPHLCQPAMRVAVPARALPSCRCRASAARAARTGRHLGDLGGSAQRLLQRQHRSRSADERRTRSSTGRASTSPRDGTVEFRSRMRPRSRSIASSGRPSRIFGSLNANGRVYLRQPERHRVRRRRAGERRRPGRIDARHDARGVERGIASAARNAAAFEAFGCRGQQLEARRSGASRARRSIATAGRCLLFAPRSRTAARIRTPDGQTILAAGEAIYLQPRARQIGSARHLVESMLGGTVTNGRTRRNANRPGRGARRADHRRARQRHARGPRGQSGRSGVGDHVGARERTRCVSWPRRRARQPTVVAEL